VARGNTTIPSLYTAEEVCAKLPKGLKDFISPSRLVELAEQGFAPCVKVDIHPEPVFELRAIRDWIKVNMIHHYKGSPLPPNCIQVITNNPRSLVPTDLPYGIQPLFECLKEYPLGYFPPCVYFLVRDKLIVYVGQTTSLPTRIERHREDKDFNYVFYMHVPKTRLDAVESAFIKYFKPEYNDPRSYAKEPDMGVINEFLSVGSE